MSNDGMSMLTFTPGPEDAGTRIDVYLAKERAAPSRSFVRKLVESGLVTVSGRPVKPSCKVAEGDLIVVKVPPPEKVSLEPEDIPLDIVYEDSDLVVVNKPAGMVVHPAAGNYAGTLVHALLHHCKDLSGIGGELRPGIVHRLDKDTSGLMVVAKNDAAHLALTRQIKARTVVRKYLAIVHGQLATDEGTVDAPIGRHPVHRKKMAVVPDGRRAVTHWAVRRRYRDFTLVECKLETGRTHQIRVHMAHIGHPVAGDPVYGPRRPAFGLTGQALCAYSLGFYHPRTGEWKEFTIPLPEEMRKTIDKLERMLVE